MIAQIGCDPAGEIIRIRGFHERARQAILHRLRRAAPSRGNHRQAGPARLERPVAEPLATESPSIAVGRVHEDRQTTENLADIFDEAGQLESVAEPYAVGQPTQFLGIGGVFGRSQARQNDPKLWKLLG